MPYVLGPLRLIKGESQWPEFVDALRAVQDKLISRATTLWSGYTFGGVDPKPGQFGITTLRMNEMSHDVTYTNASGSYSYRKNFTGTGWKPIFDYSVRDDIIQGFAGFSMTDDVLRFLQLRAEFGDRLLPIFDLQAAQGWESFGIVIKPNVGDELVLDPKTRVLLRGYVESVGYQRIVPIGLMAYQRKDLVISEI